jgi:hypothetical protein
MIEGCIICANGNDLPDGEHCCACGREGTAVGLRSAVIKARGRQEPPTVPIELVRHPPTSEIQIGYDLAREDKDDLTVVTVTRVFENGFKVLFSLQGEDAEAFIDAWNRR